MRVHSLTDFPFGTKLTSRAPPQREVAVIVRGRFRLRPGQPVTPIEQGALRADRFADDDDERTGECLYPSDFADAKRGAEVMLRGSCHVPGARPVRESRVRFTVGTWSKTLRVLGRRSWVDRDGSLVPSEPQEFVSMPLGFGNAFGGPGFASNPVGKGISGKEVANLELPDRPLRSRDDRPPPAGFGPINPAWSPRCEKVGKAYGESWRRTRAPFYAEDFDWSYLHAATPDQQIPEPLRGDEPISFENLHPLAARFATRLPGLRIRSFLRTREPGILEAKMALDTLFADLDEETLTLTWRGHAPVREDDLVDVQTLFIASEPLEDPPRPPAHYHALIEEFEADPFQREKLMPPGAKALMAAGRPGKDGAPRAPADVAAELVENAGAAQGGEVKAAAASALGQMRAAVAQLDASKAAAPVPAAAAAGLSEKLTEAIERLKAMRAKMGPPADTTKLDALLANPALTKLTRPPSGVEPGPGRDLSGRDFGGWDLSGRDLSGANLRGARLSQAKLVGARLSGANLREALLAGADLEGADLTGADLSKATLAEANLTGANLSGALLDYALMAKANLAGAALDHARGERVLFVEANLAGARAPHARFSETLFLQANLEGADFRLVQATRCMFFEARGRGMLLSRATLHGSSFAKCDLAEADVTEIAGERTVWRGATLDRADLRWSQLAHANFDEALLRRTKLSAANLRGASFYRATLDDAELVESNLFGANLAKARLARASFHRANMYEARLPGADLEDAVFEDANLEHAVRDPS